MLEFLKRLGAPIALVGLILLATLAMVGDSHDPRSRREALPWWQGWVIDVVAPIQTLVSAPISAVSDFWMSYLNLIDVREENRQLLEQVAELEETNLQYREALVASGHLQRIASMRQNFEVPMLPAHVVGLDVSLWFRSVLIDRGTDHGINSGNPLITNNGVAGLVTAASMQASRAMLLLDRQSVVDGVVQRSRARGVVRGTGTGMLEFEFEARVGDVRPGDVVITSGLDAVYPKGLRIGEIGEVLDPGGSLIQTAQLRPAVDFGRLEQVFVMFHRGPTMELLYGEVSPRNAGANAVSAPGPTPVAREGQP
jgi:rod shape-determining protein MreC